MNSVRSKITLGFGLILLVVVILSVALINGIRNINEVNEQLTTSFGEAEKHVSEVNAAMKESIVLTKNWIYQPNAAEKEKLAKFISADSKSFITQLNLIRPMLAEEQKEGLIDNIDARMNESVALELKITETLKTADHYNSDSLIDASLSMYKELEEKFVLYNSNLTRLTDYIKSKSDRFAEIKKEKVSALASSLYVIIGIAITMCLLIGLIILNILNKTVSKPINTILESLKEIEVGKLIAMEEIDAQDEVARINNSIVKVIDSINKKSTFANEIGNGKLEVEFTPLSDLDVLGNSLLAMRTNLKKASEDESKRNWANEGLARLGEILRNQDENMEKFGDRVLAFTVKYVGANQGRLYVVNDDEKGNDYLQMISCYAWDKKRFVEDRVEPGNGLTGQCWQEGEPILLTDVPNNYVKITSGLGLANPTSIFIVPLKVNETVYGIIELASFKILEEYERNFILKLTENLGAALSAVKINHRTKILLTQTQQQAEEMRSQEEEMRQNMEELNATQEEMSRKEREYLRKIEYLEKSLLVQSN